MFSCSHVGQTIARTAVAHQKIINSVGAGVGSFSSDEGIWSIQAFSVGLMGAHVETLFNTIKIKHYEFVIFLIWKPAVNFLQFPNITEAILQTFPILKNTW